MSMLRSRECSQQKWNQFVTEFLLLYVKVVMHNAVLFSPLNKDSEPGLLVYIYLEDGNPILVLAWWLSWSMYQ